MHIRIGVLALAAASLLAQGPEYTADGQLKFPANYREWIFLSSGLGMTYGTRPEGEPAFDNVFVNPPAYREFLATGRWPEKTMFALEIRQAESHASINKGGSSQGGMMSVEVEVKDSSRFPDKWAFFGFGVSPGKTAAAARPIPRGSACQTCHGQHGAVENTFVQFYPTLLEVARQKGTVKASY